ncbi:MAG: AAA family ATPase, partial [Candidatus Dadabacteria bacterium]|nr:AAA family ATPase [Candidatus Dadabacteria bacterium]
MRIRDIKIQKWRNFEDISIEIPDDAGLVCIVGANGTGKSHLLELIASCAHRLGLSQGVDIPRGDPFNDPHQFSLRFYLAEGISDAVDTGLTDNTLFPNWDRTLVIKSSREESGRTSISIEAGGITDPNARITFAQAVINQLMKSKDVHFLSLDANRAYPKKIIHSNELAQAYEIDWAGIEYTKGRSFRTTTTLYDEWIKFFLASENQAGTDLVRETRKARMVGKQDPSFEDHFKPYKEALQTVLPHVVFTGVNSRKKMLLFDTTGLELSFDQLSGGEREIAFLIGQMDRFGLRQGLFLLDEPELHLNADLVRSWVGYLMGTVQEGQIWLATHSLEAVETAGPEATFVLERNDQTRKVDKSDRLDKLPVLSALSRSVGTPAFSISKLRFVFIEGEENLGERERFGSLTGFKEDTRFIECGSCNEVLRRISTVISLAKASGEPIRVGGVVDRDFRSDAEINKIEAENGLFVLPVHEIENFYLHPQTVDALLNRNGVEGVIALDLIRNAADTRAGSWIFQKITSTENGPSISERTISVVKEYLKGLAWDAFADDLERVKAYISSCLGSDDNDNLKLQKLL